MKIGITERGDAGLDLSWYDKLATVDGAILITKRITTEFIRHVISAYRSGRKLIVHCTCTGYGGTSLEPCVPPYNIQLDALRTLIDSGFPASNCVIRIDPIFPTKKGFIVMENVLKYATKVLPDVKRYRVSILDEYKHVKERFRQHGWNPVYGDDFRPSIDLWNTINQFLCLMQSKYKVEFESCAEPMSIMSTKIQGCISNVDLKLIGLAYLPMNENPQNRTGCHCLSCKTELLNKPKQCPHGCVYCYWH